MMTADARRWAGTLLALTLSACGSGGTAMHAGALPATQSSARGHATMSITVPGQPTGSARLRRPAYVSTSTTQLQIDVLQSGTPVSGYPQTIGLTPTSPNCALVSGNTVCTVGFTLAAGTYALNLTALDGTGQPLSTAQSIALSIVANTTTTIPVILSGVPHSITLSTTSPLAAGSQSAGYVLVGLGAQPFIVNALDADNNIIVGPGSPTFSATQTGGLTLTVTPASISNALTIAPPATFSGATTHLTLTAGYPGGTNPCSETGAVCTATVSFTMQALLATLSQGYNNITFYEDGSTTALGSLTTVTGPTAMVFDSNGNLYVASNDVGVSAVSKYAPPYTGTPTTITTGVNYPNALAIDKSNNLFVSNDYNPAATITEYAPGTTTPSRTISTGVPSPDSICTDPSGNLFVSNGGSYATLTEYAPGATTPSNAVGPFTFSNLILCDGLGNMFDARYEFDDFGYYIIEVDKYGPGLTALGSLGGITGPADMAVDSANNVYVGNGGSDTTNIVRVPAGSLNPNLTITAGLSYPQALAVDPFGNVYAYDYSGKIYEYLSGATSINLTITPQYYPIYSMAFSP